MQPGEGAALVEGARIGRVRPRPGMIFQKAAFAAFFVLAIASGNAFADEFIDNTAFFSFSGGNSESSVRVNLIATPPPADIDFSFEVPPGSSDFSFPENLDGISVATLKIIGSPSLSVDDPRFEIVGTELRLKQGFSFDFETENSVTIALTATLDDEVVSKSLTLSIVDVNEDPFDLTLDNNYVSPGRPGARVGALAIGDPDAGDAHTYSVVDDERFVVVDGVLTLAEGFSLEGQLTIPVTILGVDKGGLSTRLLTTVTSARLPTSSTISLLAPDQTGAELVIPPAGCQAPASALPPESFSPRALRQPPELPGPLTVDDVDAYAIGDPIFVSVTDLDQDLDPDVRDTVSVQVRMTLTGDTETVVLTESEIASGRFLGYVYTTSQQSVPEDCVLTVRSRSQVDAVYTDPTDGEDISTRLADISPVGILFDDRTGEPVDGVVLTLVRVPEAVPAEVRGDGPAFQLYPSVVKSGEPVRDHGNNVYEVSAGEYRFPAVPDGQYRVEIFNTAGYRISDRADEELQQISGGSARALTLTSAGRFSLSDASRGLPFRISQGALPRIDIPITRVARQVSPSPSTIEFLQFSPRPDIGEPTNVQETFCVGGQARSVSELRDVSVPVPGTVNLLPTDAIKVGQPVFVRVTDADQNQDATVRDRLTIQLDVPASADREYLELTETEPNSGVFVGYMQTTEGDEIVGSCMLGVVKHESIVTSYVDVFDNSDVAEAEVLVDPFGIVFRSNDGDPIDGVTVTLIDVASGQPAAVFGDGPTFADYPNPVVTGGEATDAAGLEYDFPPGEYRFPFVEAGQYQLRIEGLPDDAIYPSLVETEELQGLPGAPYTIRDGSRGEVFEVPVGPALRIDVPVDVPDNVLALSKSSSTSTASVGDFVQYRVTIQNNQGGTARNVTLLDTMPTGFRYEKGSLRVNGVGVAPVLSADGSTFSTALDIPAGESMALTYVVEVTAGTPMGEAVNHVTVTGETVVESNSAEARIFVTEELLRSKSILVGSVRLGACDKTGQGIQGVRLYLEDGTHVISDVDGNWHIEGVKPGTHVIQLDTESLEERYEIAPCNLDQLGSSGRAYSRFVDVRGGTVWRSDFYVVQKADPETDVSLSHRLARQDEGVSARLSVQTGTEVPLDELSAFYRVPRGWQIVDGSSQVNGRTTEPERTMIGYRWSLPTEGDHEISFLMARPLDEVQEKPDARVDVEERLTIRPRFAVRSAIVPESDVAGLHSALATVDSTEVVNVRVTGHSDNVPIAPQNRDEFADNYVLSRARAQSVADLIASHLDIPGERIVVEGLGPDEPVAQNTSRVGREQNRRVEVVLFLRAVPSNRENLVLRPQFDTRRATLSAAEVVSVQQAVAALDIERIESIRVVGHSDNVPIAARNRTEFKDNYALSKARASTVAQVVASAAGIEDSMVDVVGAGPDAPIASNDSGAGRAKNRRVELEVFYKPAASDEGISTPAPDGPAVAKATVRFVSAQTPKGKTDISELDVAAAWSNQLADSVSGKAFGTWDKAERDVTTNAGVERPVGILSFRDGDITSTPTRSVRVRLPAELLPELRVNGELVPKSQIGITLQESDGHMLYNYIGVSFGADPGAQALSLVGRNRKGETGFEETINVIRTGEITSMRLSSTAENVADGRTPLKARVEFFDNKLRPVATSAQLNVVQGDVSPYLGENLMREGAVEQRRIQVSGTGVMNFEPVSRAGAYRVVLGYENLREELVIQVKPETREWIMVGLGEGLVGYGDVAGNMEALDRLDTKDGFYQDGRLAFFARGQVKGEWLLTLAYDTNKERDGSLFQRINPGDYYTLYGDSSSQAYDAPSQEKLYVRVERGSLNAMIGDFGTNLTTTRLSDYSRRMTGFYAESAGDRLSGSMFVAQTTQAFVRDDIQGNGTSGIYRLSRQGIIRNSEKIELETRDRFRNEFVIETQELRRGLDYTIDYERGTLRFKTPVFSQTFENDPIFIVAKYETDASGSEKINAGGRVEFAWNDSGTVGATVVREAVEGREQELVGVDLRYQVTPMTELRAEIATTESTFESGETSGTAYLVELQHQSADVTANAYAREQEGGFGIGQTSEAGAGNRSVGASASYRLSESVELGAEAYRETSLADGRNRDVVSGQVSQRRDVASYSVGMQRARDSGGGRPDKQSNQVTSSVQTKLLDGRLTLRASGDAPIGGSDDNASQPSRLNLGADYRLTESIDVSLQQEFSFGEEKDTQSTRAGFVMSPWEGGQAVSTVTQEQSEYGPRMYASYGLSQKWDASDKWSFDFGVDRSQTLADPGADVSDAVNPNAVPAFGSASGDFTAIFVGSNYRTDNWHFVSRIESRAGDGEDQINFTGGVKHDLREGFVLASILDIRKSNSGIGSLQENRLDLGLAWRPLGGDWTVFDRLQFLTSEKDDADFTARQRKIVNNLNANYVWDDATQISMQYAFKYVLDSFDDLEFSGFTDLIGAEVRRNLDERWDVGFNASVLHSWNADVVDYAYGVSIGRQFATNAWASVGYNFDGFRDQDFDDADYTSKGVYLKFRFKFDQDSAKQVFKGDNVFKPE